MSPAPKPLDGIKVLAFEIQVAGPYCTMMLADQGARVIKVERPEGGDTARAGAPRITNDRGETQSGYFLRFNRNKRSLTLNLKSDRGRQIFRELARKSDVIVENFRPGLLDEMGIGYKALSELNPGLIYACISGFGSLDGFLGPYSKRPAYDIVAQAMGGLMNTCGQADGPPTWLGAALGDIVSGMNAAYAIMLALYQRTETGKGQYIDISMYDTIIGLAGATSGPDRAKNMPGWLGDIINAWFKTQTKGGATSKLLAAGLPIGPVQNAQEVYDDAHVAARRLLIDVP